MRALCLAFVALAFAAPAFAQDEDPPPACMAPVAVTQAIVEAIGQYQVSGFVADGAVPSFLTGWVSPTGVIQEDGETGAVVFVRNADASWRAFAPRPGEGIVGIFAAPSGAMIIATQWMTEGPGQTWTLLRSNDGLQTGACTEIRFPAELNEPLWANETLDMIELNINARGRGEIIGVANTEERGELWYAYRTRDHGATWSAPQHLSGRRAARNGIFRQLDRDDVPPPADLVAELTAYANGR